MAAIENEHQPQASEPAVTDQAWPAPRHAWTALLLLMLTLTVSCLDRGIINLLVEPIKAEYRLTDTQFGALQSLAFGTFYVIMAIPLGFLADRYQRRIVIGVGIGLFSAFSLMTGLARNYTQLLVARMGVGFGEASVSPAGLSMIGDYFPPARLGRAISLFAMCSFIGTSLAYVVGGFLYGVFDRIAAKDPAGLLGFAPWQATIICITLPGLVLAPLTLTMREPRRRGLVGDTVNLGFRELMAELGKRRLFLVLMIAGMAMANIMTNANAIWTPALFIRAYGWNAKQVGLWLGFSIFVGSVVGSYLAGWMTDKLTRQRQLDGPIRVAAFSFIGAGVFGVAAPLMPTGELALAFMLPGMFLSPMTFACPPIAIQLVIPNQLRAQVTAIYYTVLSVLGLAVGPLIVGFVTDRFFSQPSDVRYSMSIISAIAAPLMVVLMLLALKPFRALRKLDQG